LRYIHGHKSQSSIAALCQALFVTPAGYHAWRKHKPSQQEGTRCGKHRVTRLMSDNDIKGKKFRRYSKQGLPNIASKQTNIAYLFFLHID